MISDRDFLRLTQESKESLIAQVIQQELRIEELLEARREDLESLVLPELPPVGRYVVKDAAGIVRALAEEDKVRLSEVEEMAIVFSFVGYVAIQFHFNGAIDLLSEWNNGKRIVRCQ